MTEADPQAAPAAKPGFSAARLAITLLLVVGVGVGAYFVGLSQIEGRDASADADRTRKAMGLGAPLTNKLGDAYTDADGDLVADTPKDPADQLDPAELTFSFIVTEDPSVYEAIWQPFVDHLSQAVGRPVKYVPYTSRDDQLRAIRDGELHLAGLNTGAVPVAVNACGFVPVCTPGKGETPDTYKVVFIVPADSTIQNVEALKGKRFAFTDPTSNSGCKAAVVLLEEAAGLTLGQDYETSFAHGHMPLIQAIADGRYAAGSTASDLLERAIQRGEIEDDAVRVLYESEPFPTAALGMSHKLAPELANKLRSAMLRFEFVGTPLEAEYAATGADRLVAVSYKDQFGPIRRIDNAVGYDHKTVLTITQDESGTDG